MNMNLDGLNCIKFFEIPLQVANMTWFKYYSKYGFEFKFKFTLEFISITRLMRIK
jgi:hypothetical protein